MKKRLCGRLHGLRVQARWLPGCCPSVLPQYCLARWLQATFPHIRNRKVEKICKVCRGQTLCSFSKSCLHPSQGVGRGPCTGHFRGIGACWNVHRGFTLLSQVRVCRENTYRFSTFWGWCEGSVKACERASVPRNRPKPLCTKGNHDCV